MHYFGKILVGVSIVFLGFIGCSKDNPIKDTNPEEEKDTPAIPEMVLVNGGTFTMGNNGGGDVRERPAHEVSVKTFKIAKTTITVEQYQVFCEEMERAMPDAPSWGWQGTHPMVGVSWHDATAFCVWLSDRTGETFRLPTEAEWEYASKGGDKSDGYVYSGSDDLETVGWRGEPSTHPVALKEPNELGLYDMSGNVWEWCGDWYNESYYASSPSSNPAGPSSGSDRVLRGGGYNSSVAACRSEKRHFNKPDGHFFSSGFRIILEQ